MKIQESIEAKLLQAFEPLVLEVTNESHKHSVPENSETHFHVVIVAEKFLGKKLIERQRWVNEVLADELQAGVHALSQRTMTPEEWQKKAGQTLGSPNCHGGE